MNLLGGRVGTAVELLLGLAKKVTGTLAGLVDVRLALTSARLGRVAGSRASLVASLVEELAHAVQSVRGVLAGGVGHRLATLSGLALTAAEHLVRLLLDVLRGLVEKLLALLHEALALALGLDVVGLVAGAVGQLASAVLDLAGSLAGVLAEAVDGLVGVLLDSGNRVRVGHCEDVRVKETLDPLCAAIKLKRERVGLCSCPSGCILT